jgi:hypothetical protein
MVRFGAALLAGPAAISVAAAQPADPPRSRDGGEQSVGWAIVDMKLDRKQLLLAPTSTGTGVKS